MYHYFEVPTPKLTNENNPITTSINLGKGKLDFIDIGFPDWNSRLCKIRIFYNTIQILPWNRNGWFTGDNALVRVPMDLELLDEPYDIAVHTYNLDDTFLHEISFGFSMNYGAIASVIGLSNLLSFAHVERES